MARRQDYPSDRSRFLATPTSYLLRPAPDDPRQRIYQNDSEAMTWERLRAHVTELWFTQEARPRDFVVDIDALTAKRVTGLTRKDRVSARMDGILAIVGLTFEKPGDSYWRITFPNYAESEKIRTPTAECGSASGDVQTGSGSDPFQDHRKGKRSGDRKTCPRCQGETPRKGDRLCPPHARAFKEGLAEGDRLEGDSRRNRQATEAIADSLDPKAGRRKLAAVPPIAEALGEAEESLPYPELQARARQQGSAGKR